MIRHKQKGVKKLLKTVFDREALRKWLSDMIREETEKPYEEMDMDLVDMCEAYLDELNSGSELSDDEMARMIAEIKRKSSHTVSTVSIPTTHRSRLGTRRWVAVVCAAVLVLGIGISAYAFIPAFRDMIRNVLNLPVGSSMDEDGVTFINLGVTTDYLSIDELVQGENLGIMYPHDLPDELKIKSVSVMEEGSGLMYCIAFIDNLAMINIDIGEADISTISSYYNTFESSRNIVSYISDDGEVFTSVTILDGWTYYITAYNHDHLITLLENLY